MVKIRRVEIRGFKSLGSRYTSLQFDQGLTAITGPNGSGKSNIFDAILFCLGENSPKALRIARLNSLIYDGGPERENPASLRVSVQFDNSDRKIPVDSDTVVVTREMKKKGESIYYLNGRSVSRTQLTETLELALISFGGLNTVPQGMVTRISELLPDEKRELLEEAIGISQFDEKKAEAIKQLQQADTKLQIAMARIGEIKSRVESLEAERNDQLRLRYLEDQVRWLRAAIISGKIASVRSRAAVQSKAINSLQTQRSEHLSRFQKIKTDISSLEDQRRRFIETIVEGGGGRQVEIEFEIARMSSEIQRLDSEIRESRSILVKSNENLPYLREMEQKHVVEIGQLRDRVRESKRKLRDYRKLSAQTERELSAVTRKISASIQYRDAGIRKSHKVEARVNQRTSEAGELSVKINSLKARIGLVKESLDSLENKATSFSNTLAQLHTNLGELGDVKEREGQSLGDVDASIGAMQERKQRIEEEMSTALDTLEKASGEVTRYEIHRELAQTLAAEEFAFQKLKQLSEAGAIEGFVGKLEDMLTYDQAYERAILAVGSKWMKALLITDLRNLLKVAEVVRRLHLGRIILVPVSEVQNSRAASAPKAEGVLGPLADFVSAPKPLVGVVKFLFGDTILVNSTRAAYVVASGGLRGVTISGDLFEPNSSVFETGYAAKFDSLLKLVYDSASVSSVREAISSLRKLITKRKSDLKKLEGQSNLLGKERLESRLAIERLRAEIATVSRVIGKYGKLRKLMERKISSLRKSIEKDSSTLNRLLTSHDRKMALISSLKEKLQVLSPVKADELIKDLGNRRVELNTKLEALASQEREDTTALARDQANLDINLQQSLERIVTDIANYEEEVSRRTKILEKATAETVSLQQQLTVLKGQEAELLEASKKSKQIVDDFEHGLAELRRRETQAAEATSSVERQLALVERQIDELSNQERSLIAELSILGYAHPQETFEPAEVTLAELTREYNGLRDSVNMLAERTYKEIFEGYRNLSLRRNQLEEERDTIVHFIESVEAEKRKTFLDAFTKVDRELRAVFTKLTGGSGWLELENPEEIFSGGMFLMTQFPAKVARESSGVSGGEKTVSALSFILAIQSVFPSPFYLFDEIDAHLDVVNAERLADLLKERAESSQIILVTLKDSMVSRASLVYGVYIAEGVSQVIRYRPGLEVSIKDVK